MQWTDIILIDFKYLLIQEWVWVEVESMYSFNEYECWILTVMFSR